VVILNKTPNNNKEQKQLEQVKPLIKELREKYEREEITRENLLDSILRILDWFLTKKTK